MHDSVPPIDSSHTSSGAQRLFSQRRREQLVNRVGAGIIKEKTTNSNLYSLFLEVICYIFGISPLVFGTPPFFLEYICVGASQKINE